MADQVAMQGDCLDVMRGMSDGSVTAIVTDPPYALQFMGKGWDQDYVDVANRRIESELENRPC